MYMKKTYLVVAVIVVVAVLALAYKGRHRLKMMFMGSSTSQQVAQTGTPTPSMAPGAGVVMTTKTSSVKGSYLVGANLMTLYVFDKDKAGVSNCNGACAALWPPYTVVAGAPLPANVTTIKRADGSMQYAYKGRPLYYYSPDKKAGDVLGDGFGGVWHLVKP